MIAFRVTELANIENGKLKNPNLIGTCIKTDTIAMPKVNEEKNEVSTEVRVLCHVIWSGLAPFHPAVKLYAPEDLVLLDESESVTGLVDRVIDMEERVTEVEEFIEELSSDDEGEKDV